MSRGDNLPPTMGPFSPAHQPDEGYSEDPLGPTGLADQLSALAALKSPVELPQWLAANASLLPVSVKSKLAMTLLDQLPTSAIVEIVERLSPRLYIDFIRHLPAEICLKILGYLDPVSLVSVLQTCRAWYDLAVDRKLWERLYYLEGWKAVRAEIDVWEIRVNTGVSNSIGHLHRMQTSDDHPNKIRAILNHDDDDDDDDQDMEMTDQDRLPSIQESGAGASIFGSPRQTLPSLGDMHLDSFSSAKGKAVDRSYGVPSSSSESRAKRKAPGGTPEMSLPLLAASDATASMIKSTLWTWDINSSRYRINWKYLYNMRRRLESNWELGKYKTFVLPHPDYPEEGHQECVYTLQFDANYLVSGSRDRTMRVWNMHTRRLVRPPLTGHTGSVLCLQFDADPSEDILVSGSSDSNVFVWKFSTGELVQRITNAHRESVLNVRFDKRVLVTSSKDKTIKVFNRRPLRYGDLGYGAADAAVDPVGVSVKPYGYEPDLSQELPVKPPYTAIGKLEGHGAAVNAIQVRGRTIVSVSGDRHIKVWNWPDQVCVQTIPAHEKGIACVEFDERRIVSGSSDYEVCIFDAPTGLKVASLRGHAHLVRTVQAGFGDLPYSKEEDEAEAKRVDAEYFRAVEAGEIDHEGDRRVRRSRRVNAGSSRPADLQATGAKVPPGGGGGRKYGRIVSGSYDQSIIIWRRDKEGVWKPAHHLRQEEAAEAAHRHTALTNAQRQGTQLATAAIAVSAVHHGTQQGMQPSPILDPSSENSQLARLYMAMIDQVVPFGVAALRQALATHPSMLIYHAYLQAVIEREPSPFVRSHLRQAVADGLIAIQNNQSGRQRLIARGNSHIPGPFAADSAARPSSTVPGYAGVASMAGPSSSSSLSSSTTTTTTTSSSSAAAAAAAATATGGSSSNDYRRLAYPPALAAQVQTPTPLHAPVPQPSHLSIAPGQGLPPQLPPMVQPELPGGQIHAQQPSVAMADNTQPPEQHPRIVAAENPPARVFKLQFDARKIICCSQAPVIVGWDFCNGDPELEEVARFFASID
ncbi:F-Box/WD40 repeat protein FWD-1 [Trichoderma cornu-damae]|uniref:F-Box/WD40 repeat protein FWD-1 n=1 Tax=Trichoderma cornu-damae TaxID=654480 RepID=A0A9P8TT91_9HYPO|nr:F-Box/WD40 repeat protein FWD-1 [Trichoderma cornu-damae]